MRHATQGATSDFGMLSDLKGLAIRAASLVILAEHEVNLTSVNVGIGRIFMESKSRPLYVISEVFVSQPGIAQVPREVHAGAMSDRASI